MHSPTSQKSSPRRRGQRERRAIRRPYGPRTRRVRFTGDSKSRTAALCEAGLLSVGKERGLWIASRRRLRQHYERLTAGATGLQSAAPKP
jgi:hypothetical protein